MRSSMHTYKEVVYECLQLRRKGAQVEEIGLSRHGNRILMTSVGNSNISILIVCRQHGNEPTATEAMLEYIKEILAASTKTHKSIAERIRLHIIPIANPDGAITFEHICTKNKTSLLASYAARSDRPYRGDINRDHKKRKTPEAQAIFNAVKQVKPRLIIDLHNFFPAYRYFIFQKTAHNFCPAFSTHPRIKLRIQRICHRLCTIAMQAVEKAGGKPAKINGIWTALDHRLLMANDGVLETYYPLYHDIPSLTLEALGGFSLCSKRIGVGTRFHKAAVHAILGESEKMTKSLQSLHQKRSARFLNRLTDSLNQED